MSSLAKPARRSLGRQKKMQLAPIWGKGLFLDGSPEKKVTVAFFRSKWLWSSFCVSICDAANPILEQIVQSSGTHGASGSKIFRWCIFAVHAAVKFVDWLKLAERKNPNFLYMWTGGAPIGILPVYSLNPIYVDSRCSNRGHLLFTIFI